MDKLIFPILLISFKKDGAIELIKKAEKLYNITSLALREKYHINNYILSCNGELLKIVGVEKIKRLTPIWFGFFNPMLEVDFILEKAIIDLTTLKKNSIAKIIENHSLLDFPVLDEKKMIENFDTVDDLRKMFSVLEEYAIQ